MFLNQTEPPEINRVAVNFTVSLAGLKSYRCDSKDNNKVTSYVMI